MIRLGVVAAAVVVALLPAARARSLGGAGLAFLALSEAASATGGAGAPASFRLVNRGLLILGVLLVAGAALLAWRVPGGPDQAPPASSPRPPSRPDPLLLAGLAGAAALPGLLLLALGTALAVAAAGRAVVRAGKPGWFLPLGLGAALLGTSVFLTLTILGPMGDRLDGLAAGPFSPAAERLLVLLFGGGALLLAGVPPLRASPWRVRLSPLAAILLVRVMVPGFPRGLAEWQPLAVILLGIAVLAAAARSGWAAMAVAGGLAVLWSGEAAAALPGAVLVLAGWLLDHFAPGIPARWRGLPILPAALAAAAGLASLMRAQVLVPVIIVTGCAGFLLWGARRPA